MFEKGDLVTYGCKGVCEVKNITTLNLEGIPKDRLYYEMQSMVNAGSRIFSPVGQEEKNAMRAVLTKEEAEELLGQLPECRLCWEKDERRREETYRRIINHSDARGMLCMIRTITDYGRERVLEGRRMPAMDGPLFESRGGQSLCRAVDCHGDTTQRPQRIYGGTDGRIKRSAAGALKYVRRCGCRNVTEITD